MPAPDALSAHMSPEMLQPEIVTDGGPWAMHNMPCAVCVERKAILNLSIGVFEPCGECQSLGWETRRRRRRWYLVF